MQADGPIRFLYIFDSVCNLIDQSNQVLSIQTEGVSLGQISLEVDSRSLQKSGTRGFQSWLDAAATAERGERELRLGPLTISWDSASLWDPRPDWAHIRRQRGAWRQHLLGLSDRLRLESPVGGLSGLLGGDQDRPANATGMLSQLVAAARSPALQVLAGIGSSKTEADAVSGAEALAGLGAGLTPSGDDFLIGVMHALWATREESEAKAKSAWLAAAAAPRTTPLSAAWLNAAAAGEAADHWHTLLAALVDGNKSDIDRSCRQLLSVGHSSGADALTGFVALLLGSGVLNSHQ